MRDAVLLAILVVSTVLGCKKGNDEISATQQPAPSAVPAPSPLIKSDPVASFKDFAAKFIAKENTTYSSGFDPQPPAIDVQKAESLISPVVGILTLSYKLKNESPPAAHEDASKTITSVKKSILRFAIENNRWVVQSAVGDTILYDANGALMALDADQDSPADRLALKAQQEPMPDLDAARKAAAELQP